MKNKIIFYGNPNERKKLKFKIIKMGIITIMCVSTLTGCFANQNTKNYSNYSNYNNSSSYSDTSSTNSSYDINNPNKKTEDLNSETNAVILKLDNSNYKNAINKINSINVNYDYESYYNINQALNAYNNYINNNKNINHNSNLKNLTADDLYNVVLKNNKNYLSKKKKDYVSSFYKDLDNSTIREYCKYIVEQINYLMNESSDIDYNKILCVLGDLKMFKKADLSNAYITDDNCLIVTNSMDVLSKMHPDINAYEATIKHETGHLVQKNCKHEIHSNLTDRIGISYEFDNLKVNPLYYNWLYEGSTEKNMCNALNIDNLVYSYFIGYINSLEFSQILNDKNNVHQIENLSLQKDLNKLYEAFNADTNEKKLEVLKLMYSLTILENEPEDFFNAMGINLKEMKTNNEEELKGIKRVLKTSIFETLTKYFYKNLLTAMNNKQTTMNDVFFLITLFENDINYHLDYSVESEYKFNKNFMKFYAEFQKDIFQYIAQSNNMSINDIYTLFYEYSVFRNDNGTKNYNCSLKWLNDDKKQFAFDLYKSTKAYASEHIIDSYERFSNQKVLVK